MKVKNFRIRKILATNSEQTIEIELGTEKGTVRSSVPIGTSKSKYENFYLPTDAAVSKFQVIKRAFTTENFSKQKYVDEKIRELDSTAHFQEIGGNLAIGISSAFLKAFALERGMEIFEFLVDEFRLEPGMPAPICNVVGGWKGQSDIQEFLLMPVHQKTFTDSIYKITHAYKRLGDLLKVEDKDFKYAKNIESAWVTSLHFEKVLDVMKKIADQNLLKIGLDVAASQLWKNGAYVYSNGEKLSPAEQLGLLEKLAKKYPIFYIEDPFNEDDWLNFATAVHRLQPRIVCGDDIYATRSNRLLTGIDKKTTNAAIIKPNQVGTISEAVEFAREAKRKNIITVMSHRSGETEDVLVSHLAVGLGCDYAKIGISGERIAKINELIRIEERLSSSPK